MADDQNKASGKDDAPLHVLYLDVGGMHCINCATLVEQRLGQLAQVRRVWVEYPAGHATVTHGSTNGRRQRGATPWLPRQSVV